MSTLQIIRREIYMHKLRFGCEPAALVMTFPVRDALLQDLICQYIGDGGNRVAHLMTLADRNPYKFELMGLPCRAYATPEGAEFDGWMSWGFDGLSVLVITGKVKGPKVV